MIVSAPNYGHSILCFKLLFEGLKIPFVLPDRSNSASLELGVLHAPEGICQPFKMMLGNYIQSIEKGADTIILLATSGPCKFGEYANLQERLLKKAGYEVKFIIICTQNGKKEFLKEIKKLSKQSPCSPLRKILALKRALHAMLLMDDIEGRCRYLSGYERDKGACKTLLNSCMRDLDGINNPKKSLSLLKYYKQKIKALPMDFSKNPLKIAVIGEIFTLSEPFSNKYIEDHFMDQGASISRSLTPSWWLKDSVLKPLKINSFRVRKASREYIYQCAGGYTRETIGKALIAHDKGYDGAVQIFPVGCTPEIIAKPILEKISSDKGFPILTLIVDEMTGEEGFLTRVEAFTDLLERRREKCII